MDVLYGFHAVEEALRSGSRAVEYVAISRERAQGHAPRSSGSSNDPRLEALMQLARANHITVRTESRDTLTRLAQTDQHQGAVAVVRPRPTLALEDLLVPPTPGQPLFLLALDWVEDPHNLGALLRTADGAGVTGILIPDRRSAPLNSTVARTSAGASEHVRIARVPNLNRALETIKERNIWTFGLDERGIRNYDAADYTANTCLVLGREGEGLHELTRRHCDFLVRIPMLGAISSLNVSVAGAVVMYEAARQRRAASASLSPAVPCQNSAAIAPAKRSRLLMPRRILSLPIAALTILCFSFSLSLHAQQSSSSPAAASPPPPRRTPPPPIPRPQRSPTTPSPPPPTRNPCPPSPPNARVIISAPTNPPPAVLQPCPRPTRHC